MKKNGTIWHIICFKTQFFSKTSMKFNENKKIWFVRKVYLRVIYQSMQKMRFRKKTRYDYFILSHRYVYPFWQIQGSTWNKRWIFIIEFPTFTPLFSQEKFTFWSAIATTNAFNWCWSWNMTNGILTLCQVCMCLCILTYMYVRAGQIFLWSGSAKFVKYM